jgi:hypothetical protein
MSYPPSSPLPPGANVFHQLLYPTGADHASYENMVCGFCGHQNAAVVVATWFQVRWFLCMACQQPSAEGPKLGRVPKPKFGPAIQGLPAEVATAYDEARGCMSVNAYAAAELMCRQILAHAAVDKKADKGKPFLFYIDHLETAGYVTPTMKPWVDAIRKNGNETAHDLVSVDRKRAENTMLLTAQLLRLIYEMDHLAK